MICASARLYIKDIYKKTQTPPLQPKGYCGGVFYQLLKDDICLFRTKNPVACITETGYDISVIIKTIIQCCTVDIHIGMSF